MASLSVAMERGTGSKNDERLRGGVIEIAGQIRARRAYTKDDLADLFLKRWNIELDSRSIKIVIQMDVLCCKSPDPVDKEIWVHMLAYNILRGLMATAAAKSGARARVELQRDIAGADGFPWSLTRSLQPSLIPDRNFASPQRTGHRSTTPASSTSSLGSHHEARAWRRIVWDPSLSLDRHFRGARKGYPSCRFNVVPLLAG